MKERERKTKTQILPKPSFPAAPTSGEFQLQHRRKLMKTIKVSTKGERERERDSPELVLSIWTNSCISIV